ncbi:hypothetical protein PY365_23010 [Roseiarcaceae bacterium H3SJ34-1]|uniref:hypothetical protein n=1 Tax=Terripilifer ovatus TaxID=3032367 RepID=UPI003AB94684|nr:hypothetical protein [Roseiarcaceae bacterium H3SJ34-1]
MRKTIGILVLAFMGCSHAYARDGFEKVRCDGDIAKALIGPASNETVMAIEARHKDLKLKDLGASDYGRFSSITWSICGREFMVLEENRRNIVRDALELPAHSDTTPAFEGTCKLNGKPMPEYVVGTLREESGKDELQAVTAWKVDEKAIKFVKMPTDGLLCSRDGIVKTSP